MLKALDNLVINKINGEINETYDNGEILEDFGRSIFMELKENYSNVMSKYEISS